MIPSLNLVSSLAPDHALRRSQSRSWSLTNTRFHRLLPISTGLQSRVISSLSSYPPIRRVMLQHTHSLDFALQEADGLQVDHMLAQANVSPFFSSQQASTEIHEEGKNLSRVSSFCDFTLEGEEPAIPSSIAETDPSTTNAWEQFLSGPVLKTPTTASIPAYTTFVEHDTHHDPTALSPTHTDKKVLVTDHDLKLDAEMYKWDPYGLTNTRLSTRSRPNDSEFGSDDSYVPIRPRRALLSDSPRHSVRYTPYPHRMEPKPTLMPRFPAVGFPYLNSLASTSVFPLVDHHWRRTEPSRPMYDDIPHKVVPSESSRPLVPTLTAPPRPLKSSKRRIGIYTPEARRERLRRFHEKRKKRIFHKRTQYDCRQRLAQSCPRVKGRFVRKHAIDETKPQASENDSETGSRDSA